MKTFHPEDVIQTPYLFFTGKGGVGKTTTAVASAIHLARKGKRIVLVSTDPASNLQDLFNQEFTDQLTEIDGFEGRLKVANFDPKEAAFAYKERVVAPYRGKLPESALQNMEEQLMGSCTLEVAAFDQFASFLTDDELRKTNDYIIFDTAPTGHTLRMLELPAAWTTFLDENTTGTSCMGQLSGLGEQRKTYRKAVDRLADPELVTLVLVSRPQKVALLEADRAAKELRTLNIKNQLLVLNGLLDQVTDDISQSYKENQNQSLEYLSDELKQLETYYIPLRAYNLTGIDNLSQFLADQQEPVKIEESPQLPVLEFDEMIQDLITHNRRIIFTMGKGGVGKTSVAIRIAQKLHQAGVKVHLTTTDPADHLDAYLGSQPPFSVSHIDEKEELNKYSEKILSDARETMDEDDLDYVIEDLKSPCTQEIAIFNAFAELIAKADEEVVVVDTAPTGHTLLLLESTQSYAREIQRSSGQVTEAVQTLLPRLQNPDETEVVMVTLPEPTPFYESSRLHEDLKRAGIANRWWVINQSLLMSKTNNPILRGRAQEESKWIEKVLETSQGKCCVLEWLADFENSFNN